MDAKNTLSFFDSFFPGLSISTVLAFAEIYAKVQRRVFEALTEAGFTEDQAMALVMDLNRTILKETRLLMADMGANKQTTS